jgi:hypothetical protein
MFAGTNDVPDPDDRTFADTWTALKTENGHTGETSTNQGACCSGKTMTRITATGGTIPTIYNKWVGGGHAWPLCCRPDDWAVALWQQSGFGT